MKQIRHFLWIALLAFTALSMSAQSVENDPDEALRQRINDAVMKVYNEHLAKDPNDYTTLYMRAGQYFNFGKLDSALVDINRAIELTPKKEKELMLDELMMRAAIYDARGDLQLEREDLTKAAELSPSSPAVIEMTARLGYKLGDYDSAYHNYESLLRRDARNYNAMYGLAQVEIKRNNTEEAIKWVDRAIEIYPANPMVYLNKGDILEQANQPTAAAQTYLLGMISSDDNGMSIERLFALSDTHYDEVMNVLRMATDEAPRVGVLYRIRSSIAANHNHYGQAMKDIKTLLDNDMMTHDAIFSDAALCEYHLTDFNNALKHIDRAIELNNSEALYYTQRGDILSAMGKSGDAISAYDHAIELDARNQVEAFLGKARVYLAAKDNNLALRTLNEGLTVAPDNSELLLTRAWVYKYRTSQADAAIADCNRVIARDNGLMTSLKGFALHEVGRDDEARAWAQKIINDNIMPGGQSYYYAAVLMSYIGDNDKAMEYWTSSLANGFGSKYEAMENENPYLNLRLLRKIDGFKTLMGHNSSNFEVK